MVLESRIVQVLVIDDDVDTAESAAMVFRFEGVQVATANNGATGLELAKTLGPELILLDLAMPEISGYQVAEALRAVKLPKRPFVVAVSGYGWDIDKRRCIEAGFDLHLTKPVEPQLMLRLLKPLLHDVGQATWRDLYRSGSVTLTADSPIESSTLSTAAA